MTVYGVNRNRITTTEVGVSKVFRVKLLDRRVRWGWVKGGGAYFQNLEGLDLRGATYSGIDFRKSRVDWTEINPTV